LQQAFGALSSPAMSNKDIPMGVVPSHRIEESKPAVNTIEQSYPQISEKVGVHAQQGDEETARYASQRIHIDDATNKLLFWKINKRILVIMLVTYFCQSMDKGTLGFSSIMGIKTDAHLVGQDVRLRMLSTDAY
jgi:hypothetical protein